MKTSLLIISALFSIASGAQQPSQEKSKTSLRFGKKIVNTLLRQLMSKAEWALKQEPVTVTAESSPRTAGGKHDFYSEGDYWWPNPVSADSPYIQRDGMTNPDNFVAHRLAMIRLSQIVGALASVNTVFNDEKYVKQVLKHCRGWFVDTATMMNPNLLHSQAIKGR